MTELINKTNIFGLTNPLNWTCRVNEYKAQHSTLGLVLVNSIDRKGPIYIDFTGVNYFDGPTSWQNGNFETGSYDERFLLWKQSNPRLPDTHIHVMARDFQSYFVEYGQYKIRIAAFGAIVRP